MWLSTRFLSDSLGGPDANALLQADFEGMFVAYITATSLTDMFYVTRRQAGSEEACNWLMPRELLSAHLNPFGG